MRLRLSELALPVRNKIYTEKLTVAEVVRKFLTLLEQECSLPCPLELTTEHYHKSDESIFCFFKTHLNNIFYLLLGFTSWLFLSCSPTKNLAHISHLSKPC
jgi:hypothetical protein